MHTTIEDDLAHLVESIRSHRKKAEHIIIYCCSLNLCADSHAHFHAELGDDSYYPPGALQQDALSHFRKSEPAMRASQNHQKAMQTPNHCLIQDVSIQWNGTYFTIEHLTEQRWPLTAVFSDNSVTKRSNQYLHPKTEHWDFLGALKSVLYPLQVTTTYLSAECNVSVSTTMPWPSATIRAQ